MAKAGLSRLAVLILAAASLGACGGDGRAPRMAELDPDMPSRETKTPVYQLQNLDDPYGDWFIAPERGLYFEFGAPGELVSCEAEGYACLAWPFAFSFPLDGAPSMAGWEAGGMTFVARYETERDFCGAPRDVWMIEADDGAGGSTRVWYDPDFGIYSVMIGQAEDGRMARIERAYATCERGLYSLESLTATDEEPETPRGSRRIIYE